MLPLVYSTIAIAVTIETIGDYWFVLVGAFFVVGVSYVVATLMRYVIPITNERDFQALRVAATYPNIMALPILIFPSLCEFSVVHEGFIPHDKSDPDTSSADYLESQCVAQSTTMIFIYFFSWSLCLWSFGNNALMKAAQMPSARIESPTPDSQEGNSPRCETTQVLENTEEHTNAISIGDVEGATIDPEMDDSSSSPSQEPEQGEGEPTTDNTNCNQHDETSCNAVSTGDEASSVGQSAFSSFCEAVKQTTTSPGFLAMIAAFVTACIPPLQEALFEGGGPLRFLGSSLETLGVASSPLSTMVVAASLVPLTVNQGSQSHGSEDDLTQTPDENPIMSDPTVGPYQPSRDRSESEMNSKFASIRSSLRSSSARILKAMPRPSGEMLRLHVWFCLSRLVISPFVIVALIVGLDCGSDLLMDVHPLSKFVLIINAALPGAQVVIVLLKAREEMADTAAAVAKVYMPSYLLSIITIAAWTSIGLWVTLPDDDGNIFCRA